MVWVYEGEVLLYIFTSRSDFADNLYTDIFYTDICVDKDVLWRDRYTLRSTLISEEDFPIYYIDDYKRLMKEESIRMRKDVGEGHN